MPMVKWNPLPELEDIRRRMDRLLDASRESMNEPVARATWQPLADICEDEDKVVIRIELPGIPQDEIDLRLEGHSLVISGERPLASTEGYQRVEGNYGPFERSFLLPPGIDEEAIVARCELGVLEVTLPKQPTGAPKQIVIKTD
ncbi:MAG: Hsp20/alpha crystallin family protein [Deltaproteobacteria bacterium]|nr:MAG: Hsp20/alpha crystallin family protein [Deltaproteobacteria bacterium]